MRWMTRWLLLLALTMAGCATPAYKSVLVTGNLIQGYKPCRVQWDADDQVWINYDNYSSCQFYGHPLRCMTIYIPATQHCFQRIDGTTGSECP